MPNDITWEPRINPNVPSGPRQRRAEFYDVRYDGRAYTVMLGVEPDCCYLLEHAWIDESHRHFFLRHHPLPYWRRWATSGEPPMRFSTRDDAMEFVNQRIREWRATGYEP
jgi:hypothetical protein